MAAEIAERSDDADRQGTIPVRPGLRSDRHELTGDMLCERARQSERVPLAAAEQALPSECSGSDVNDTHPGDAPNGR